MDIYKDSLTCPTSETTFIFAFKPDKDGPRADKRGSLRVVEASDDRQEKTLTDGFKNDVGVVSISKVKTLISCLLHGEEWVTSEADAGFIY
jgi:hypothetical protein